MTIKFKNEDSNKQGVYIITNIINNKVYIGSTTQSFRRRYTQHFYQLQTKNHCNEYLQNSWMKYGNSSFIFDILELCNKKDCLLREQYWLDFYQSWNPEKGYNLLKNSNNSLGYKHKDETKKRMSDLKIGKQSHPNTKKAVLLANIGRPRTKEEKEKISIANKGKKCSAESIEKRRLKVIGTFFKNKRKIIMFDYNFKILQIFESTKKCSEYISLSESQIRTICNGRSIQKKDYILMYEHYPISWKRTSRKIELKWRIETSM